MSYAGQIASEVSPGWAQNTKNRIHQIATEEIKYSHWLYFCLVVQLVLIEALFKEGYKKKCQVLVTIFLKISKVCSNNVHSDPNL